MLLPNRVVAIATAIITLALAALPVVADMDWRSTAGILGGIAAVLGVTLTWLKGWQNYEQLALTEPDTDEFSNLPKPESAITPDPVVQAAPEELP